MPDPSSPVDSRATELHLPPTAGDGTRYRTAGEVALEVALPASPEAHRVGWVFISLYTLAFIGTNLVFQAPLLVTLPLKVNSLVGIDEAPTSLALVAGDRRAAVDLRQSVLRQDERSHVLAVGHAAALDGHRPAGRFPRHPHRRAGTQHPGRPGRMVHRPAVLQRTARRPGGGDPRPGPDRATRHGLRCRRCLSARRGGERAPSWSSSSPATSSRCSSSRVRSAGSSSCSSR